MIRVATTRLAMRQVPTVQVTPEQWWPQERLVSQVRKAAVQKVAVQLPVRA